MPQWIPGPDGSPVYVDDTGAPASPLGGGNASMGIDPAALASLYSFDPAAPSVTRQAPEAPPVPQLPELEGPASFDAVATPEASAPPGSNLTDAAANMAPGTRVGQNTAGFSDEKYGQVKAREKGVQAGISADRQRFQEEGNALLQDNIAASQSQAAAAQAEAQALSDAKIAEGQQNAKLAALQVGFAEEEKAAYAEAAARSAEGQARYESELEEYRAMRVDPNALFKGQGGAFNGASAIGAAFVQGFLGAKGIKITAVEQINRTIDQNIDAQITAMNQKAKSAEGFKQLWDMQRAQSQSDAEARSRVRGFMLQSAKDQVLAEMAQFDSKYALAKGNAVIAGLEKDLVKTKTEIYKEITNSTLQAAGQRIQLHGIATNAALTREGHQIQRDENAARLAEAQAKAKAEEFNVVRDVDGEPIGYADTKEEKIELQTKVTNAGNGARKLMALQAEMKKVGATYQGKGFKTVQDTDSAKLKSMYNDMISSIVLERSGKAASDKEREVLQEILPYDTFTRGILSSEGVNVGAVAAAYGMKSIDDIRGETQSRLRKLSPDQVTKYRAGQGGDLYGAQRTAQQIVAEERDKPGSTPEGRAAVKVEAPDAGAAVEGSRRQMENWYKFQEQADGAYDNRGMDGAQEGRELSPDELPKWAAGMSDLGKQAKNGSEEAQRRLLEFSDFYSAGIEPGSQEKAAYAQYLLYEATGNTQDALQFTEGEKLDEQVSR